MSFYYSALDFYQPSIRLVRLIAGSGPLQCEIFHTVLPHPSSIDQLTTAVPYEALSYTWGRPEKTETILANGRPLDITTNLYLALSHLRREDVDRILWVDAICIDQHNGFERTHQVRQMGRIYACADRVIFWLGQATYATNVALDSLKALEDDAADVANRQWKKNDTRWWSHWAKVQTVLAKRYPDLVQRQREGLNDLLDRPWFERVWIIQEVANSQRALVCCGTKAVSARVFALAPSLFAVKPSEHSQSILDVMPGRSREASWWAEDHDLYTLLRKFRFSEAHDPRDMIYALVGIASDPELEEVLIPDYDKTEREVIQEAVSFLCHLDIDMLSDETDGYWNAMVDDQSMQGFLKTIDSLYIAAVDQHIRAPRGDDTTYFFSERARHARVTNEMLKLADTKGDKSLETVIMQHVNSAMLENAAKTWTELHWLRFLLEQLPPSVAITESVLEAGAKNVHAVLVLEMLLQSRAGEARLTERVLCTVANSMYVYDILTMLLEQRPDEVCTTPRVLRVLKENESHQKAGAMVLLRRQGKSAAWKPAAEPKSMAEELEQFRSEWMQGW